MKRSLQSKLLLALTSLTAVSLLLGGGFIIAQNTQQLREDIYLDALTFAELTNDQIVNAFEQFYVSDNFLQFRRIVNPLLQENIDINSLQLIGKSRELLYDSSTELDVAYLGLQREHDYQLDRTRDIKASLLFESGEVIYALKDPGGNWTPVDINGEPSIFPGGEVQNIVFPHNNARIDVVYGISYDALFSRILEMALSIGTIIFVSLLVVAGFAVSIAKKLVDPIQELEKAVVKIGKGSFGTQAKITSDDEIGVLAKNFNRMSRTLKKNTQELLEKEKLTKELDIAREIQQNMLPSESPQFKKLDVSGSLRAATQIGGDVFDYLGLDEKGGYIFIADVTGHGVPAGMVANITHSSLYSFSTTFPQTDKILQAMNKVVHAKTQPNMFATALLGYWDDTKAVFRFANAGHEELLVYKSKTKTVEWAGKGGMALGMVPNAEKLIQEQELRLETGDVVVLYTDGIPEAWKSKSENLSMQGFEDIAKKVIPQQTSAEGVRKAILESVDGYRQNYPQQDDITIIVLMAK